MVIASRQLNPLCTDLMMEGYAAKGFHIKAKTCDWGPMAGFVALDPCFTKASQCLVKQKAAVIKAVADGVRALSGGARPAPRAGLFKTSSTTSSTTSCTAGRNRESRWA